MRVLLYRLQQLWQKKTLRMASYGFVVLVIFGFLMNLIVMPVYTKHNEAIQVPDVTKMRYEDARDILESQGFKIVQTEERYDSEFPSGYVIEQSPEAGALVKSGRRVYVILSRGERRFEMPSLIEHSERDAELILAKNGLHVGQKHYEFSTYYLEGVVSHQSIAAGVEITVGTHIDLTISLGAVPDVFTVPSVEGRTLDDAREKIERAGLKIGSIRYEVMPSLLPETVIKQSIQAGTQVSQDEVLDLVVSMLPANPGDH